MKPIGGRYRSNFLHKIKVASRLMKEFAQGWTFIAKYAAEHVCAVNFFITL
ncbi:MAG: hypothetical protein N3F10_00740 [Candidatus Bathyarchaeota archaeon]|nr:hypothetical protein [Candidatus Bathyarchaeota archaeon]MCX8176819.1 hypothetical protein [Candidatus Bathyarchaeota archaeon]MDW8193348.1 hypothetical protein [Nitrososphaerota archaeon]